MPISELVAWIFYVVETHDPVVELSDTRVWNLDILLTQDISANTRCERSLNV